MVELEYLTDRDGQLKAVVVPIELWKQFFPNDEVSAEELVEAIEDYCLAKAMDEGRESELLSREEALSFLEE
ncbi:MAG: hypothetical protein KDJ65_26155 [Anaerolineae bacterium]|nr:hypothetical protein [Anaerolineae bacterium]